MYPFLEGFKFLWGLLFNILHLTRFKGPKHSNVILKQRIQKQQQIIVRIHSKSLNSYNSIIFPPLLLKTQALTVLDLRKINNWLILKLTSPAKF